VHAKAYSNDIRRCGMVKFEKENASFKAKVTEAGIRQTVLSRQTGIPLRTIQDWCRGERNIQGAAAGALKKVADQLGCTIEDLL